MDETVLSQRVKDLAPALRFQVDGSPQVAPTTPSILSWVAVVSSIRTCRAGGGGRGVKDW